jgi:hypothetical protein
VPPGKDVPAGQKLFTDWKLNLPDPVTNHTQASHLAYSDPRVYEWLRQEPPAQPGDSAATRAAASLRSSS